MIYIHIYIYTYIHIYIYVYIYIYIIKLMCFQPIESNNYCTPCIVGFILL